LLPIPFGSAMDKSDLDRTIKEESSSDSEPSPVVSHRSRALKVAHAPEKEEEAEEEDAAEDAHGGNHKGKGGFGGKCGCSGKGRKGVAIGKLEEDGKGACSGKGEGFAIGTLRRILPLVSADGGYPRADKTTFDENKGGRGGKAHPYAAKAKPIPLNRSFQSGGSGGSGGAAAAAAAAFEGGPRQAFEGAGHGNAAEEYLAKRLKEQDMAMQKGLAEAVEKGGGGKGISDFEGSGDGCRRGEEDTDGGEGITDEASDEAAMASWAEELKALFARAPAVSRERLLEAVRRAWVEFYRAAVKHERLHQVSDRGFWA